MRNTRITRRIRKARGMAHFVVDKAAVAALPRHASVDREVHTLADEILDDAKSKAPVDSGALRESGFVDGSGSAYTVGFDKEYAPYVEAGTDDTAAQPFLSPASLRDRGSL